MNGRSMRQHGTTLVELTIAVAIMATVFTAVLPLFAGIRNSSEARWAGLEMVQNARVLNEFLCRHLAEARRVVGVSGPTDDRGYIEFETAAGTLCRCGVADGGDIEFGPVDAGQGRTGSEPTPAPAGILAGPVEYLRFTCHDGNDLVRPAATAGQIRLVTWEVGWRSANRLTHGRTISGSCCLRVHMPVGNGPASRFSDGAGRPPERITPLSLESSGPRVPGRHEKPVPGLGWRACAGADMAGFRTEHGYARVAMALVRSVPGQGQGRTDGEGML
jgi:type II secretory pathway pseudopilin PulG